MLQFFTPNEIFLGKCVVNKWGLAESSFAFILNLLGSPLTFLRIYNFLWTLSAIEAGKWKEWMWLRSFLYWGWGRGKWMLREGMCLWQRNGFEFMDVGQRDCQSFSGAISVPLGSPSNHLMMHIPSIFSGIVVFPHAHVGNIDRWGLGMVANYFQPECSSVTCD